jgi:hypothetical protein
MALFPLRIPPGVVRDGTEYGSKGRYFDAWHTRWTEDGILKPTGGWRTRSAGTVTGSARACMAWKDNSDVTRLLIGTHSHLYVQDRAGTITDITPSGFTPGRADAVSASGYGKGPYGVGTYGTPRPDATSIQMASQWTFDTFGETPIGVMPDDGIIYEWDLNTANVATEVTDSPTCRALVVTAEGFLFALGTTDPRTVSWSDQRDMEEWTPDATNQAGDFALQTAGALMCGKVVKGGVLLFTDLDVHLAQYVGGTLIYGFDRIGTACGVVSRQCVAAIDAQAVWMGNNSFWLYNGYIQPLACDVQDYVFGDFNAQQASKTYAVRDSANSEILFYYCSASSNEIDRCVIWNYKANYWNIGRVSRTCGTDRGVFAYPIFVSAAGSVYEHEVGGSYDGAMPYAEAGPLELGDGDRVARAQKIITDEKTQGDVTLTFKTRFAPNGPETSFGPYSIGDLKTDVRFEARQAKLRVTGAVLSDWRFGVPRLELTAGGRR